MVLANKALIEDVWQPQIEVWLKDTRHKILNSAEDAKGAPSAGQWNGQIILVNKDAMVKGGKDTWKALKKLNPEYIFVDEGTELANKGTKTSDMVGELESEASVTWVVSATPFKVDSAEGNHDFTKALPYYEAVTRKRVRFHTLDRRLQKAKKERGALEDITKDDMNFIIAFARSHIQDFLPVLERIQKPIALKEGQEKEAQTRRRELFMDALEDAREAKMKVVVAGMTAAERAQIESWLGEAEIEFASVESDQQRVLRRFATDDDVTVCLMHRTLKIGIDSLKVAQKVIFWNDQNEDFANVQSRTSIIKRIRRLGSTHKTSYVEYYPVKIKAKGPRRSSAAGEGRSRSPRRQ